MIAFVNLEPIEVNEKNNYNALQTVSDSNDFEFDETYDIVGRNVPPIPWGDYYDYRTDWMGPAYFAPNQCIR